MPSKKHFAFFYTSIFFIHSNFPFVKVHNAEPNGDEERRGGDVWFPAWD